MNTPIKSTLRLSIAGALVATATAATSTPPNIVLILMEDMGTQISPYGDHTAYTPALERLAREGAVFTRAQVTAATCAPSRASLFTGLYPHQHGVFGFSHVDGFHLRPGVPNYVRLLHDAGYRTGITYKTGLTDLGELPFDSAFSPTIEGAMGRMEVSRCLDHLAEFLRTQPKDRPFYFQAQTSDTHTPWDNDDRRNSIRPGSHGWPYPPIDPARIPVEPHYGPGFEFNDRIRQHFQEYYGSVQRADFFVGAVLDLLREHGVDQNTLVVFSADHGPSHNLRGKGYPYEISLRVPFIVRWPGVVSPGKRTDALVSFVDLLPTFLEAAGIDIPGYAPGQSLVPMLRGAPNAPRRTHVFSAYNAHTTGCYWPNRTVSTSRYKLIHNLPYATPHVRTVGFVARPLFVAASKSLPADSLVHEIIHRTDNPPEFELYDLTSDPGETVNLAGDPAHAAILIELKGVLARWQNDHVADPFREPTYLAEFTRRYRENEAIYDAKVATTPKRELRSQRWHLDWPGLILPWDPTPYRKEPFVENAAQP